MPKVYLINQSNPTGLKSTIKQIVKDNPKLSGQLPFDIEGDWLEDEAKVSQIANWASLAVSLLPDEVETTTTPVEVKDEPEVKPKETKKLDLNSEDFRKHLLKTLDPSLVDHILNDKTASEVALKAGIQSYGNFDEHTITLAIQNAIFVDKENAQKRINIENKAKEVFGEEDYDRYQTFINGKGSDFKDAYSKLIDAGNYDKAKILLDSVYEEPDEPANPTPKPGNAPKTASLNKAKNNQDEEDKFDPSSIKVDDILDEDGNLDTTKYETPEQQNERLRAMLNNND